MTQISDEALKALGQVARMGLKRHVATVGVTPELLDDLVYESTSMRLEIERLRNEVIYEMGRNKHLEKELKTLQQQGG